jgi:hypothetical protein
MGQPQRDRHGEKAILQRSSQPSGRQQPRSERSQEQLVRGASVARDRLRLQHILFQVLVDMIRGAGRGVGDSCF